MTQVINDNLQINGDVYLKADNYVSLHYGNRGRLGQTPNFNPDNNNNGLWLEASTNGSESGGLFCNGNTIVLWSPGDNDTLRVYDEDSFSSPKFVIDNGGNVGINTTSPQKKLHIVTEPSDRQIRLEDSSGFWEFWAGGNFHIREDGSDDRLFIRGGSGNVGIGTTNPQAKLDVNGDIKVKDWTLSVPDYVFDKNYELRNLDELRTYIDSHKHLPEMPCAQKVSEEGVNLGEFCMSLLKKIEELSLYVLQQDEIIQGQNERLATLERSASV